MQLPEDHSGDHRREYLADRKHKRQMLEQRRNGKRDKEWRLQGEGEWVPESLVSERLAQNGSCSSSHGANSHSTVSVL